MRLILAVIGIGLLAMVAVMGFDAALADNSDRYVVENETFTPDAGNVTVLENSNLDGATYNDTVRVWNASDVEMTDGQDYEWHHSNGTLRTLEGGDLANDSDARITYDYERPPEEQLMMSDILSQIPSVTGLVLPVFALVFLLLIVRGG